MKKIVRWSTLRYAAFLVIVIILSCEIVLRIYNPFPFRLKGTDILLPRNQRYLINNTYLPGLDSVIVHTKNSMGFRGPELPGNYKSCLSVFTVGGSTTECWNLQEKDSWPFLLGQKLGDRFQPVWLNNAGYSGLSSWAHYLLINEYIKQMHPKLLFLLVGWNDVSRPELAATDDMTGHVTNSWRSFMGRHSELYNLVVNIKRHYEYKEYGKVSNYPYLITRDHPLLFTTKQHDDSLVRTETVPLDLFKKRLSAISDTCRSNGIQLVLITQPCILGHGIEPQTGCNLDDYKSSDNINGKLFSQILNMFNQRTREVAAEKHLLCVDLANLLPPKIENYYDNCHYNKEGCKKVAQIIYDQSIDSLKANFPSLLK